jgi:hypothetical protein
MPWWQTIPDTMKMLSWLGIQRAALFLYLSLGVLLLVYSLGFITDVYLFYAYGNQPLVDFYREMQVINAGLLGKAVLIIIFAVVLFVLQLRNNAAGLFTLIIVLLVSGTSVAFAVDSLLGLSAARSAYTSLDLSYLQRYIDRETIKYTARTLTYDIGFVINLLFMGSSLFLGLVVFFNACRVHEPVLPKEGKKEERNETI